MSKDAYYFPHDSNAKDDPKCVLLIEQLGMEGYGIFWMLIETLRDQPGYKYPINLLPALARRYNTDAEAVKTVVCNFQLFTIDAENVFFSQSLINRMIPLEDKRKRLSEAGKKGNATRWKIATQSHGDHSAIATQSQVKESKVNQSKTEHSIGETHTVSFNRKGVVGGKQNAADLLTWVEAIHPTVHAMAEPLTEEQAMAILTKFNDEDISRIIEAIDNKGATRNKSAYMTFNSFVAHDTILKSRTVAAGRKYTYNEMCDEVYLKRVKAEDFECREENGVKYWVRKIDLIRN